MSTAAIIVAAGRGTRAGGDLPKQWQDLRGQPVLAHSLAAFRAAPGIARVVLVIHPDDRDRAAALGGAVDLVEGGASRDASVRNALESLAGSDVTRVLIHDGARPLVSQALIARLIAALDQGPGAAPAVPVTDALWRGEAGRVAGTQDRTGLFRAQTPQAFHFDAILAAHRAHPGGAADDVEVARAAGLEVVIVEGDEDNLKVTYPGDFARAARSLKDRLLNDKETAMDIRTGNGFDVHAFGPGDHVWLCGVRVPHHRGLIGHSDADVGMHALTDAIYGALAEGDIGTHFPPSDPQWKGAASEIFLRHAMGRVAERGFVLTNCDVTLICERPKIGPMAAAMREALAGIMGIEIGRISVKATTSEKLGFTGREEGIASLASVTLLQA
ncbi:2-C-methyl-D-erythritol 2,4-cyclodiphosphate synthase [Cereibacter ovatus]|uniref:Bifunctional enzyme IspD/IspF n=1 Tax=Cereibacter ovatus TaxID=439529 RepID=A0A285D3H9_9RHOB|nr:bifunctional 2-C-methyl-D-erythritol 4-phosphate cytidylyltransferase/2-C-methyl-D-erythritol 2,4-cyclodiphosphate synthase [Cereibacter ovatus]SNX73723.1 2-C-methyl-D-erythritol 2,4-cyclodiphosphate synthase [Cereibacter ovatus]